MRELSRGKPSQDPAINDGNPFVPASLEDPPQNAVAHHVPRPPVQQVLVRESQGCPGRREEEDVQEDISSHAL